MSQPRATHVTETKGNSYIQSSKGLLPSHFENDLSLEPGYKMYGLNKIRGLCIKLACTGFITSHHDHEGPWRKSMEEVRTRLRSLSSPETVVSWSRGAWRLKAQIVCACVFFVALSRDVVPILVPRARRFLVTWSWNEGLWKQPLPILDVRKLQLENERSVGRNTRRSGVFLPTSWVL